MKRMKATSKKSIAKKQPQNIHRSSKNKMVAGIFGGLSEIFGVDANIIRMTFLVIIFLLGMTDGFRGIMVLTALYLLAWLIIPLEEKYS
jgi:phage shock protein C